MAIPAAIWAALAAMGPGAISAMMGNQNDPKRLRRQALGFLDPSAIQRDGESFFQQTLQGPGFNMARSDILGAGQSAQGAMQRHLGQTGLGRSGVGTAMMGAASAAPGVHLGRLTSSAWDSALAQARGLAQARASTIMGMPGGPSPTAPLFAGGMNALLPFLFKMLSKGKGGQNWGQDWDQGPGGQPGNFDGGGNKGYFG